jgi:hypothetical protein
MHVGNHNGTVLQSLLGPPACSWQCPNGFGLIFPLLKTNKTTPYLLQWTCKTYMFTMYNVCHKLIYHHKCPPSLLNAVWMYVFVCVLCN